MALNVQTADIALYSFDLSKDLDTEALSLTITWKVPVAGGHMLVTQQIYDNEEVWPDEVFTDVLFSSSDDAFDNAGVTPIGDPPAHWYTGA